MIIYETSPVASKQDLSCVPLALRDMQLFT